MPELSKKKLIYVFDCFQISVAEKRLLKDGREIKLIPKAFDLLLFLVENDGQLLEKQILADNVWKDSHVDDSSLSSSIYLLRKALGDNPTNPRYIETVPKRGVRFVAKVKEISKLSSKPELTHNGEQSGVQIESLQTQITELPDSTVTSNTEYNLSVNTQESEPHSTESSNYDFIPVGKNKYAGKKVIFAGVLIILLFFGAFLVWQQYSSLETAGEETQTEINSPIDDAEIRQVVRDSQVFEFLSLNTHPEKFAAQSLPDFWLPAENGGQEILKVKAGVKRMTDENKRYGDESRLERFDFSYVKIYAPGNRARAGTIERWYLPLYQNGKLIPDRNVYFGPYPVDYILQKFNGKWLIERTTTPRAEQKK